MGLKNDPKNICETCFHHFILVPYFLWQFWITINRVLLRTVFEFGWTERLLSLQFFIFNVEPTLISYLTFSCTLQKSQLSLITFLWLVQLQNTISLFQSPFTSLVRPCLQVQPNNFPAMEARSECNQQQSLGSTAPRQNTQREQKNVTR